MKGKKGEKESNKVHKEKKEVVDVEKENKKKEREKKKKALDERDYDILTAMSNLNKSVIVLDERRREADEKEKEISGREKQRREDLDVLRPESDEEELYNVCHFGQCLVIFMNS